MKRMFRNIASGSQKDFRSFFDMYYPMVYRFIHYFLPTKEDCEEVVSEVFYTSWRHREHLPEIENIRSWLYIVSRNEAYNYIRQKEKYVNISIDDLPVELSIDSSVVDERLLEEELLNIYRTAVAQLPERCKLIFLMARDERLKYKEIAHILSITEGTVEQQMHIAIRKITATVQKHYP